MLNLLKIKSVLKLDDELQRYWGLKIEFSGNLGSVFLKKKIVLSLKLNELVHIFKIIR